jgi:hypothetical protein
MHNLVFSGYMQREIFGVQSEAFLRSKLERLYIATKCTFSGVHWSWKQMHDKWRKMKDKYEIKKKKTQVTNASPFDWPWFERFDQMFGNIDKINGFPNAIDQGVQNLHSHFEVQTFEVSDEDVDTRHSRAL